MAIVHLDPFIITAKLHALGDNLRAGDVPLCPTSSLRFGQTSSYTCEQDRNCMENPSQLPESTKRSDPWSAVATSKVNRSRTPAHLPEQRLGPLRSNRCLGKTTGTRSTRWTTRVMILGLVLLCLTVLSLIALRLSATTSDVGPLTSLTQIPVTRSHATPSRPVTDATGPGTKKPPSPKQTPVTPQRDAWPTGAQSSDLTLIATNIPQRNPRKSTTLMLDEKSGRYVLLSKGDFLGDFEVVSISMDWVQLRRAGSFSWVSYRKSEKRRTRGAPSKHRPPPPRIRRRSNEPSVTLKWMIGRLNLAGELEDHLRPTTTKMGLQVGRVTSGFRRIGLRVGDVVELAGGFPVSSLEQLRNGLQKAAHSGGSGTLTVLRKGKSVQLSFGVR